MTASSASGEGGPFPSYCLMDIVVDASSIQYSYRRNNVRFYVSVRERDLVGPGSLLDVFRTFKDNINDPEAAFEFEQWVLFCLDGFMKVAAPVEDPGKTVTLLDYYTAPAYAFHLVNIHGQLCPVQDKYDPDIHGTSSPRTAIVDDLPDDDSSLDLEGLVILRSSLPAVPHFLASQLERISDGLQSHEMSSPPRKVRLREPFPPPHSSTSNQRIFYFFKASVGDRGHLREMCILGRIAARQHDVFAEPFRTSRLAGLVVWDNDDDDADDALMGLLMDFVPGRTLAAELLDGSATLASRRKWFAQVEATVARLHEAGMVWGDVKPDNVMINEDGDAVLVDFGGGYTPRYIPRSMHETVEGDLMGLRQMRAEMLPE